MVFSLDTLSNNLDSIPIDLKLTKFDNKKIYAAYTAYIFKCF